MPGVIRPGLLCIYPAPFGINDLQKWKIYFEAVQPEVWLPSVAGSEQDQPESISAAYRLCSRCCAKLAQDRTDMKLGGVLGYPKLRCDLLVSSSAREQSKNLSFACSQRIIQVIEILFCAF